MTKGSQCVVFLYYVLSNGVMVSRKSDHGICMGLKTLRREASGLKKMRSERTNPLETSTMSVYDEGCGFGQSLNGH
jgi:hypothetical protein